jgi:hypothetical protein
MPRKVYLPDVETGVKLVQGWYLPHFPTRLLGTSTKLIVASKSYQPNRAPLLPVLIPLCWPICTRPTLVYIFVQITDRIGQSFEESVSDRSVRDDNATKTRQRNKERQKGKRIGKD